MTVIDVTACVVLAEIVIAVVEVMLAMVAPPGTPVPLTAIPTDIPNVELKPEMTFVPLVLVQE